MYLWEYKYIFLMYTFLDVVEIRLNLFLKIVRSTYISAETKNQVENCSWIMGHNLMYFEKN